MPCPAPLQGDHVTIFITCHGSNDPSLNLIGQLAKWIVIAVDIAIRHGRAGMSQLVAYKKSVGPRLTGIGADSIPIVPVPRQYNKRDENEKIKAGETPQGWEDTPNKKRQKDVDARWTKKHGKSYYGYKNHINVDRRHKFIRTYEVSNASLHDSQALDDLIDPGNTSSDFWADSAYHSQKIESELKERGYRSRIHHKGKRGKPLAERQKKANNTRSKVRVRVEHVFGFQERSMGGKLIRSIGIDRAKVRIGMMNLVYNMKRFIQFESCKAAPG